MRWGAVCGTEGGVNPSVFDVRRRASREYLIAVLRSIFFSYLCSLFLFELMTKRFQITETSFVIFFVIDKHACLGYLNPAQSWNCVTEACLAQPRRWKRSVELTQYWSHSSRLIGIFFAEALSTRLGSIFLLYVFLFHLMIGSWDSCFCEIEVGYIGESN